MSTVPHEFVTVDMRGLRRALSERARSDRVSVSSLVREFVAAGLQTAGADGAAQPARDVNSSRTVKLSLRISTAEAQALADGARHAGISRAAYLAELIVGAPRTVSSSTRAEQLALLAAANAELSTLSRSVRQLLLAIRGTSTDQERLLKATLVDVDLEVRRHLSTAAGVLAEVRQRRLPSAGRAGGANTESKDHG